MVKCLNCLHFKFRKGWEKVRCVIESIDRDYAWKTTSTKGTLMVRAEKMKKLINGCNAYENMDE
jgi:hypothetical protein